MKHSPIHCVLALVIAVVSISAPAQVPRETSPEKQRAVPPPAPIPQQTTPQLTKEDVESFLDGLVPVQLERDDIAGAVVCVVKDGQVLFAKGYGFADVKSRKPVTADATLFRPGSISKTFTWTAVMQQVEQGKIDLSRDVNDYLDYKIPATFGKPVTMNDIMSHTSGFEETIKDLFVANASDVQQLSDYLPSHLPKQIYPPGTTPAYSNYATTVAGYIVQRVSGMPFNDYIDKNIFQPLGMNHTTFRQPLPGNLKPLMSSGYKKASEPAKSYEFVNAYPAGSVATTAADMSHWMIAHLNDGEYNGARILKPETAQLMHARLFENVPQLNGMAHGFYEETRNGHRIIGHGGDTQWFHSDMHLMLDQHLGFFVSYNSAGKGEVSGRSELWKRFLDRYFPYMPPPPQQIPNAAQDAKDVAGTYWVSRRPETNIMSAMEVIGQATVTANSDGTISINELKDFAGNPKHFREIAPLVFREEHGQDMVGFKNDYAGRRIFAIDFPFMVFQPAPILKNGKLNITILGFALAMFVLTLLFWPINASLRSHYGSRPELAEEYRKLRTLMRVVCILNLLFVIFFGVWLSTLETNIAGLSSHYDTRLHLLQIIGLVGLLGSLLSILYALRSWQTGPLWIWTKVWNTLLMVGCLGYVWFLLNWHLLNFSLRY